MQAHASKLAKDPEAPDNRFKGFDEFMASAKAQAATKAEPAPEAQVPAQAEEEDQPYSPSQGVGSGADPDQPDLINLIASSDSLPRKEVGLMSRVQVLHLKHLHNVEMPFYCPQVFLSLDLQCKVDVSELNRHCRIEKS